MIPNIKSSEGIETVSQKSYTCGLRVYHVQRASGNPVYTRSNHQSEKLYPTA
jgi:hypothetical protein